MKIAITFDIGDTERRMIAAFFGQPGLADRATCKNWIENHAIADIQGAMDDFEKNSKARA